MRNEEWEALRGYAARCAEVAMPLLGGCAFVLGLRPRGFVIK
jgi:hypothetical protein